MLRSIKELAGFTITASNGDLGSVATFYFDDQHWPVRYRVVKTGHWLADRRVLVSPIAIGQVDPSDHRLVVNLTKEQVAHSPDIDIGKPVSRQREAEYHNYYGWPYYWADSYTWNPWTYPAPRITRPGAPHTTAAIASVEQESSDSHLRSIDEVIGYHIQATDDEIGHVEDFILDDETWQIRYMTVDTSNWWFGKRVLVAPGWVDHVSWDQ